MKTITVLSNGDVQFFGDVPPVDLPLGQIRRTRVSTILPVNPTKRAAFRLVRSLFGDGGSAAAWTRRWSGPWIVRILATGQSAVFEKRAEAIAWELTTLSENDSIAPLT